MTLHPFENVYCMLALRYDNAKLFSKTVLSGFAFVLKQVVLFVLVRVRLIRPDSSFLFLVFNMYMQTRDYTIDNIRNISVFVEIELHFRFPVLVGQEANNQNGREHYRWKKRK